MKINRLQILRIIKSVLQTLNAKSPQKVPQFVSIILMCFIKRARGVPLGTYGLILLESSFKFSYPVHFPECFKNQIHPNYVKSQVFFISMNFSTHTLLQSSVYCNAKNIIHLYVLLVKNTDYGFSRIS